MQIQGRKLIGAAKAAEQGADGEDKVDKMLSQLPQGWKVERNIRMPGHWSASDLPVQSPSGSSIVLEVKAHKGKITADGQMLCRVWFGAGVPFPKDFIAQVTRQAAKIREARKLGYVHAVLVFTEAKVLTSDNYVTATYCKPMNSWTFCEKPIPLPAYANSAIKKTLSGILRITCLIPPQRKRNNVNVRRDATTPTTVCS